MAIARYFIKRDGVSTRASHRSTPELDFLRGEEGSIYRPDVLDDADIYLCLVKVLKAFFNILASTSMPRAMGSNEFPDRANAERDR